ncbi:hypothetical protein HWV01_13080 [Moritella sp. 5]|uniref:hypothetical protein n=1 Tax=Moritella sp. 5 TaxID=2746231 RepID=UPI001BA844FE|nr:hypothetical protein [Moritella sp. 5]QUM81152.1 hypothetical protein HWV01_13080 [Moritella sp. 5]
MHKISSVTESNMNKTNKFMKAVINPISISLLALVLSLFGLFFSYQANDLAKEQYRQNRLIVLKANFLEDDDTHILVAPVDSITHGRDRL